MRDILLKSHTFTDKSYQVDSLEASYTAQIHIQPLTNSRPLGWQTNQPVDFQMKDPKTS